MYFVKERNINMEATENNEGKSKGNKLQIPEGVIDKKAFITYWKLSQNDIIQNPMHVCSDGREINIAALPHHIRKWIAHLPVSEQNEIEALKQHYFDINNNMTVQKRKAYGKRQGPATTDSANSILDVKKEELLEYFGRMYTVEEVLKIVNKDWGISIGKKSLYDWKNFYAEDIQKRIENHQNSFHNIRLGIKKSRLEEYSELYGKQKEKYEEEGRKREDLKVLLTVLNDIRREAEGDRLTIDGKMDIKYEQNIQAHLMTEVFQTINLKEIIIGRVAAKMGINPIKLLYALNNSYYKKYSNVLGDFDPDDTEQLAYPSQLNYDFERIGKNFKLRDKDIEDAIIIEDKSNTKSVDKGLALKQALIDKLKAKSGGVAKFKNKLDNMEQQKKDGAL